MTAPQTERDTVWSRLRAPLGVGVLGLGAAALLRFRDPHSSGSYGFCPFQSLTGQPCPGCGGLRAVNDLTRGDVVAAVSSNALAVGLVVGLAAVWIVWITRRARGRRDASMVSVSPQAVLVALALVAVFGVLRVTPWGTWLAP